MTCLSVRILGAVIRFFFFCSLHSGVLCSFLQYCLSKLVSAIASGSFVFPGHFIP